MTDPRKKGEKYYNFSQHFIGLMVTAATKHRRRRIYNKSKVLSNDIFSICLWLNSICPYRSVESYGGIARIFMTWNININSNSLRHYFFANLRLECTRETLLCATNITMSV